MSTTELAVRIDRLKTSSRQAQKRESWQELHCIAIWHSMWAVKVSHIWALYKQYWVQVTQNLDTESNIASSKYYAGWDKNTTDQALNFIKRRAAEAYFTRFVRFQESLDASA